MNEIVKIERPLGLVPETMAEAMRLADMMATAKLVPPALHKSPADCLMVIQQAIRWDMDPFAVAQECSVIQGKLMHSGKLIAAVVNARGNLTRRLAFEYAGDGDDRSITVVGQLRGEAEPRTIQVKLKDAKTANRVWQTQPDQQLMYHGVRVWARRHTPELMLGVRSPEEFDEAQPVARRPKPAAPNVMLPPHNPETGEIIDKPTQVRESSNERSNVAGTISPTAADEPAGGSSLSHPSAGVPTWQEYVDQWDAMLDEDSASAEQLHQTWSSKRHKDLRSRITWNDGVLDTLKGRVVAKIAALKGGPGQE